MRPIKGGQIGGVGGDRSGEREMLLTRSRCEHGAAQGAGLAALILAVGLVGMAEAQVPTFAGNAQHTSNYAAPAENMNAVRWSVSIDQQNTGFVHYGSPLVTASNTVITGIKIAGNAFKVSAFSGVTGAPKYTLASDYILPDHNWIPVYNPAIVSGPSGPRLYYAGAGGTIFHVDGIDSNSPSAPVREVFYAPLSSYLANRSGYNSTVFINTPITSDANGNVFFGFRIQGTAPAPLSTTQSGYARIDANGSGTYVLVGAATGDANITRDCHNTAPALSNDGGTLYVVAKSASTAYYGYLIALDSSTLATRSQVFLRDPRNSNGAGILDDGTASPMVAPDGDVFFGVFGNPYNGSRGWLLHFTGDLSVQKVPGAFGWDFTPGIVPASMVPSYSGASAYLLVSKYNNYANVTDGNGINQIAILDPNATQTDFHPTAPGQVEMREVMTIIGPTPDPENPTVPNAIREWCINTPTVNPATNSVFVPSEDGHIYRWNLAENSITQSVALTAGIGEPYVPTVIGPDGTIYTLNGGYLFALGGPGNFSVTIDSSAPSVRSSLLGDSITLTATIASGAGTPTGTVTFTDRTFNGFTPVITTLAANVPVDGSGHASVTTSTLQAGGAFLGNHWITASYNGDATFPASSITRLQKVHVDSTTTVITSSPSQSAYGAAVTFSATVSSSGGVPTGYVTFLDGATVIGQNPLDASGVATFSTSALSDGTHSIAASYYSDTQFASSSGATTHSVSDGTTTTASGSPNPSTFSQVVTFTATVTAAAGGGTTPAGAVTFKDGATTLGSDSVDGSGHAAVSVSSLSMGSHTISANFAGIDGWLSSSGSTTQNVRDGTSTAVAGAPSPSNYRQTVTFTATVTAADAGAGTPAGTVTFRDGSTVLGSATVDGAGHASLSTSSLGIGTHTIAASFVGSGGWLNSSGTTMQTVKDVTAPNQVTGVTATSGPAKRQITVKWSATIDPDDAVAAYLVYSSGTQSGPYTLRATVTTLNYADSSKSSGTVLWYYLVARDTAGNLSVPSAKVSGKAK
jgi:hypothetical protein